MPNDRGLATASAEREPIEIALAPSLDSVGDARRTVLAALHDWGLPWIEDDVAVVISELASNAVLHARTPYTVTARYQQGGVRIEVSDESAQLVLPSLPTPPVPTGVLEDLAEISAVEDVLHQTATTGRGMRLVTSLADSWGIVTWNGGKTVWADIGTRDAGPRRAPDLPTEVALPPDGVDVRLIAVPVRLMIESDRQFDDIEREAQVLAGGAHPLVGQADLVRVAEEARASNTQVRAAGRHAVRDALVRGDRLVDVHLRADEAMVRGFDRMRDLLRLVGAESRADRLLVGLPGQEILRFGLWYRAEVEAQMAGRRPMPCPFPTVPRTEDHRPPARLSNAQRQELTELREQLAVTTDVTAAGSILVRRAVHTLQGSRALLCLLDESGVTVRVAQQAAAGREMPVHQSVFALSADLPAAEAIRTGHIVMLRTGAERDERYPILASYNPASDPALVCLPLAGSPLGPVGCLLLSFAESRTLTARQLAFLRQVADAAGAWFAAHVTPDRP